MIFRDDLGECYSTILLLDLISIVVVVVACTLEGMDGDGEMAGRKVV